MSTLPRTALKLAAGAFSAASHLEFHVNDGLSLGMIDESSVDFVFSFDSLVHAESEVIRSYLGELGIKLSATGFGFIHHSNLGAFLDPDTGELPFSPPHERAASMSALLFRQFCEESGLRCIRQELINWGGDILHDCFSVFARVGSPCAEPCSIWENPGFMLEAGALHSMARHYRLASQSPSDSRLHP